MLNEVASSAKREYTGKKSCPMIRLIMNRPQLDAALAIVDMYGVTLDWIYLGDPSGLRYELGEAIRALRAVERDT